MKSPTHGPGPYWPPAGIHSPVYQARFPDAERQLAMARQARDGQILFWQPWDMEKTRFPRSLKFPIPWGRRPLGDVEWPHSLARFPFMVDLAYGFARTDQSGYLEQWRRIYQDYHKSRTGGNPFWDQALDTAIRSVRIVQSWDIISRHRPQDEPWQRLVIADLEASQALLHSRLGSAVGNWEFIICSSLLLVANYLGQDDNAPIPAAARRRLAEIRKTEINADGLEIELAPMYQGVIILYLLEALAGRCARSLAPIPELLEVLELLMGGLKRLCRPDGRVPAIGDSDPMPFPYLENLRRAVTGSDPAATGPAMAPGDGLLKASNILIRDRILGDGRSQLIFDAAGLPPERRRWHSHQDDLQVLLSLDGRPIWIDPGRFTYTQEYRFRLPGTGKPVYPRGRLGFLYRLSGARTRDLAGRDWRRYFQSRSAHNVWHCLDPEGRERPLATGNIQPLACTRTDGLRLAATALRDEDGYEHIRWIVEIGTETLLLVDGARSPHPTPWAGHFLFPDDIVLEEGEGQFVIRDGQRGPLLVQTIREVGARGLEVRVTRGWFSPCYNEKRPAPVLHLESPPVAEWVVMTAVCRPGVTGRILQELNAEFEGSDLIIVGRAAAGSLPVRIPDFWAAGG